MFTSIIAVLIQLLVALSGAVSAPEAEAPAPVPQTAEATPKADKSTPEAEAKPATPKADPAPVEIFPELPPPCEHEDGPGPCYWDAKNNGNHEGRDLIVEEDGSITYLN